MSGYISEQGQKILMVSYEYQDKISGGIGRVINGIVPLLRTNTHIDVFHIRWKTKYMTISGDHYHMNNEKEKCVGYGKRYCKAIEEVLDTHTYDIVHILHLGSHTVKICKLIKSKYPTIKIVYSCHSLAKPDIDIRNSDPKKGKLEVEMFEKCDHIHVLNKASLKLLDQCYPGIVNKREISLIANGIDENDYVNNHKGFGFIRKLKKNVQKDITVMCISRWSYGKGIEYVLEAVPLVTEEIQNIKFVIGGRKLVSWEKNFHKYVYKIDKMAAKLRKHVEVLGWLNDKERNSLFEKADICIMPSELEYFPYSLLEPMITKTAVISSNIDCATEIFEDRKECFFFETTNAKDLADKIIELVKNDSMRKEVSETGYEKVKNTLNWSTISNSYSIMYTNTLASTYMEEMLIRTE